MTRIHKLSALALATILAAAVAVVGMSSPAMAASISVSISGSRVTVTGNADDAALDNHLIVVNPAGDTTTLDSYSAWSKRTLTGSFTAETNGSYTAKIEKKILGIWWGVTSKTFTVRAAPAAPSGLSATASGNKINVSWNVGNEIDLSGYRVNGGGASKSGSVSTFCSGTSCSTTFTTSATGVVGITVTAMRAGGTTASATTDVTIGSAGGGAPGSQVPNLPNGAGGTTPLSPASPDSPYNLPNVAPEGSNPNFAYPTPPPQVASTTPTKNQSAAAEDSPSLQWGKSIAIALILLICAAHLGTWTRRLRLAQGDGPRATRLGRARVSVAQARIAQAEALAKAGVLSKEAILGNDGDESKTKKGLLRRKKAGQEVAALDAEAIPDAAASEAEGADLDGFSGVDAQSHGVWDGDAATQDVGDVAGFGTSSRGLDGHEASRGSDGDGAPREMGGISGVDGASRAGDGFGAGVQDEGSLDSRSESVEDALAALTRGAETRVDLHAMPERAGGTSADSGMGIFAPAEDLADAAVPAEDASWRTPEAGSGGGNDSATSIIPLPRDPDPTRKPGRRTRGRRRAK